MGTDAADVRRRRQPRRGDPRAARARRRRDDQDQDDRHRAPVGARSRGQRPARRRCSRPRCRRGSSRRRGRCRRRSKRRASCSPPARFRRPRKRRPAAAAAAAARGGDPDDANAANSFNPEEINPPVSSKGGMTALLHAARQGHLEAVRALLDGGAPIDQVGSGDATSPLLMAVINGEFDLAMFLIERGANPNLAAGGNGATPLWAAVNTQWQPRTRYPQPQEMEQQKATYLDVMKALLAQGRRSRRAPQDAPVVSRLQRLRQPQLRPRRHRRLDRVLARGLRDRPRRDEAARRVRRRSQHPDRSRRTIAGAPRRRRPAAGAGGPIAPTRRRRPGEVQRAAGPGRRTRRAARFMPRPASSTAKASPATPIVTRRTRGWR